MLHTPGYHAIHSNAAHLEALMRMTDVQPHKHYLDLGTGASKFTWQTYVGVGYTFGSWDVVGAYKYVSYSFKSGDAMEDLTFSGPAIAAVFRW